MKKTTIMMAMILMLLTSPSWGKSYGYSGPKHIKDDGIVTKLFDGGYVVAYKDLVGTSKGWIDYSEMDIPIPGGTAWDWPGEGVVIIYSQKWERMDMLYPYGSNDWDMTDFGASVAEFDGLLAVGTPGDRDGAGAVYIFKKNGQKYSNHEIIRADKGDAGFGSKIEFITDNDGEIKLAIASAKSKKYIETMENGFVTRLPVIQPHIFRIKKGFGGIYFEKE